MPRLAIAAMLLAWPAAAQTPPTQAQADAIRSNCGCDFLTNYSGVPRGGKEALDCLKTNQPKLSAACGKPVSAVN